jgi:glutaredoxin
MDKPELLLYVKAGCPWCDMAEEYLEEHGYKFRRIDVLRDRVAYDEMRRISGQTYAPTLVVEDEVLPDFGPEELEHFLKIHEIYP